MSAAVDFSAVSLPRDEEGPVFDQPWQAHAFSVTMQLHSAGVFTWPEWVETLSREITRAPQLPDERSNDAYYRQWLAALVTLVDGKAVVGLSDLATRTEEWRQAYINTPHGHPVELANAACAAPHHHHAPSRGPIAVKRAGEA